MPTPRTSLAPELSDRLAAGFERIRRDAGVSGDFPPDALAAADLAAAAPATNDDRADRRGVELVSIDPAGSRDLDQALHLRRRGSGYRLHYAIADVGAFVHPGDPVDTEARRRGTTIYCPDLRVPLHPTALSEGAASLLPGVDRPAILWSIDLDQHGSTADVAVARAVVRNRRAWSYTEAQTAIDAGQADEQLRLLEEIGRLRIEREVERGGVSLDLPDQNVERVDDHYELHYEAPHEVEAWNAQLSLCCGMAAADLMVGAGVGLLRTLPPPAPGILDRLRLSAAALGVDWPDHEPYARWVRSLDTATAAGAALMAQAARTLRGSGYLAFDGADGVGPAERHAHHAIAAPYAHVTAPLRRLADRFANECVLAAAAGRRPPSWVLTALPDLPALMGAANQRASAVDRAVVDLVEAAALEHLVGSTFDAVVTAADERSCTVQIRWPAVIATAQGRAAVGSDVRVRLDAADPEAAALTFTVVP